VIFVCFLDNQAREMDYNFKIIKNENHGLKKEFLNEIRSLFSIDTFIETGTYLGYTTEIASNIFNHVHSVELSQELFGQAQLKLGQIHNISLYKGDSAEKISEMIDNSSGKLLFWLDGAL
jgi:protein-L-isoaspartate O-methyltransferase